MVGDSLRHYELNAEPGSYSITGAPVGLIASGSVFAFVQPVRYSVETQPPAEGLHPRADHHDPVAAGGDFLLVFVVILLAGWQMIVRVVRVMHDDEQWGEGGQSPPR